MSVQNFTALLLNLDCDTARLDHMRGQLQQARIAFMRLPGVLGDAVPDDLRPYFFNPSGQPKTTMKRGEIGCYASHLRALMNIATGAYGDVVLVMEDDLAIAPDMIDRINALCSAAPAGWDIVRLSNAPRRAYAPVAAIGDGSFLVRYSKIPTSAGAYLITPAGARKFLHKGVRGLTFDDDLRRPWFHQMETYGVVPPPICAGVTHKSSIDSVEAGRFSKGMSARMERIMRGDHLYLFKRMTYNIQTIGMVNWSKCCVINGGEMLAKIFWGRSLIHDAAKTFPTRGVAGVSPSAQTQDSAAAIE
jgi:glycosyl transferase family 25